MNFIDEARIHVSSGRGGAGCISFRRQKFAPRGGPDGGNGGQGGDVVFEATERAHTLLDYRYRSHYSADNGEPGDQNDRSGSAGPELVLAVPAGTRILDDEGNLLFDLDTIGARFVVARGGRGGKGNTFFARSTRQAPDFAQPGEDNQELWVRLELQLLADVGLLGFPNAGKSTLISRISSATPRVASYPFTTLVPNLGVVGHKERRFVVADLPGLIEGAHEGKGLGDRFLRHLSRTKMLLYLLPIEDERDPPEAFQVLKEELRAYDEELVERPFLVVLSKSDLILDGTDQAGQVEEWRSELLELSGLSEIPLISGVSGEGLELLLDQIIAQLYDPEKEKDLKDAAAKSSESYDPRGSNF